IPAPP
ncbi:hypothetical protein MK338_03020, partial [Streptococcus vestibularis]